MNYLLVACVLLSMLVVYLTVPPWIKRAKKHGLSGKDIHKVKDVQVAEMGGICVIFGFMIGILSYVALTNYYHTIETNNLMVLAILCSVLITTIIGIVDDVLGWKIGLRQYEKPFLTILATIPVAILVGSDTSLIIPFHGMVKLGLLFPVVLVPLVIVITTNGFNMVGGYNGLETGLGIIILTTLGFLSLWQQNYWVGIVAFSMVFPLMAFISFNARPASVFPGDTLTYSVGALIGIVAVVGNLLPVLLILFVPYIIEFFLKLRGMMQKESFAKVQKDGFLTLKYPKLYGMEHAMVWFWQKIRGKASESNVTYGLCLLELLLAVLSSYLFVVGVL